jgi:hypothetical protein
MSVVEKTGKPDAFQYLALVYRRRIFIMNLALWRQENRNQPGIWVFDRTRAVLQDLEKKLR